MKDNNTKNTKEGTQITKQICESLAWARPCTEVSSEQHFIGCSLCLECSTHQHMHSLFFPIVQVSDKSSLSQGGLPELLSQTDTPPHHHVISHHSPYLWYCITHIFAHCLTTASGHQLQQSRDFCLSCSLLTPLCPGTSLAQSRGSINCWINECLNYFWSSQKP